jgi:hypothetical protein
MCEQTSAKKRKLIPDPPDSVLKTKDLRDVIVAAKARNLAKMAQDAAAANTAPADQTAAIQTLVKHPLAHPVIVPRFILCHTSCWLSSHT